MFDKLNNYLNKPFPMLETSREKIGIAFYFGLFVFFFLLIFQPFGLGDYSEKIIILSAGYGIITFLSVLVTTFGFGIFSGFFDPDSWTIGNHLTLSFVNLFIIVVANWLYSAFVTVESLNIQSFFYYLFITFAVGFFPVILSVFYYENRLDVKNKHIADETTEIINARKQNRNNHLYRFESSLKNESFSIVASDIICIKAEGNYCNFFHIKNNVLTKKLLRISLKAVEKVLETEPKIIRCHRSWLINLEKVKSVSGTARNISLTLEHCNFKIPVSRNYTGVVTNILRHI